MSFVTARIDADPRDRPRHYVNLRSRLLRPGCELAAWTVDLSGNGARVGLDVGATSRFEGAGWALDVPDLGRFPVIRLWHRGATYGLGFEIPEAEQDRLARELGVTYPARP